MDRREFLLGAAAVFGLALSPLAAVEAKSASPLAKAPERSSLIVSNVSQEPGVMTAILLRPHAGEDWEVYDVADEDTPSTWVVDLPDEAGRDRWDVMVVMRSTGKSYLPFGAEGQLTPDCPTSISLMDPILDEAY